MAIPVFIENCVAVEGFHPFAGCLFGVGPDDVPDCLLPFPGDLLLCHPFIRWPDTADFALCRPSSAAEIRHRP